MPGIGDLIPSAKEIPNQTALQKSVKAEARAGRLAAAEAEKRAMIKRLSKPSGLPEDERIKLASTVIQRVRTHPLPDRRFVRRRAG